MPRPSPKPRLRISDVPAGAVSAVIRRQQHHRDGRQRGAEDREASDAAGARDHLAEMIDAIMIPTIIGSMRQPEPVGDTPWTICM